MSRTLEFRTDLESEAATARKFLEAVPEDKFDWKPHEKSMTLGRLATHMAEIPAWVDFIASQDVFAADDFRPAVAESRQALLDTLEKSLGAAAAALEKTDEAALGRTWQLTMGEKVVLEGVRLEMLKNMVLHHLIHHRGQLGVFLRLLGIPVPGAYGPTADEIPG